MSTAQSTIPEQYIRSSVASRAELRAAVIAAAEHLRKYGAAEPEPQRDGWHHSYAHARAVLRARRLRSQGVSS